MLAQRSKEDVRIDAIEIEERNAGQARENIAGSPWAQKVTVIQQSIESYSTTRQYDLIVSNPPYFSKSLLPPDQHRTLARHTQSLTFENLLASAKNLLSPEGRFSVVLPFVESKRFTDLAAALQLFPARRTTFQSRQHKPIERVLIEFSGEQARTEESSLILYGENGKWSDEYIGLTKEFYKKI
jgi:tRNA1Val (adenine37-N6)-methyltransferase